MGLEGPAVKQATTKLCSFLLLSHFGDVPPMACIHFCNLILLGSLCDPSLGTDLSSTTCTKKIVKTEKHMIDIKFLQENNFTHR